MQPQPLEVSPDLAVFTILVAGVVCCIGMAVVLLVAGIAYMLLRRQKPRDDLKGPT